MTPEHEQAVKKGMQGFRETILRAQDKLGQAPASDYDLDRMCLSKIPFGHSLRFHFMVSCMKYQWPDYLVFEADGKENYWLMRIAREFCRTKMLSLLGCASSQKTSVASACAYTIWKASPHNTTVILSTTDDKANDARGWGTVSGLYDQDRFKVGKKLPYKKAIVLEEDSRKEERDYRDAILGVPIPRGQEGAKAIGSISGRHNVNVYWICDELPHMELAVLDGRVNMVANRHFQWVGIGNRPNEGDPLYIDAEPSGEKYPNGWESVNPDTDWKWTTRTGVCLYFDGLKSPNLQFDTPRGSFPGMINREMIDGMRIASFGEDSPNWWRQVRGFPNQGDVHDRVMTSKVLESFGATDKVVWQGTHWTAVSGLDLGLKEDGDPCVADFGRVGVEASGQTVLAHETETVQLVHSVSSKLPFEQQISKRFVDECEKRQCHMVALDISGGGGIMALAIKSEAAARSYPLEILSVDFGGSPSEEEYDVGGERKPAKELFDRKVSELWYSYRLAVQNRVIRGVSLFSRATKQLCERKVIMDERKRWSVEKKSDMKKRIRRSPDDGDSRVLLHFCARHAGLSNSNGTEEPREVEIPSWDDVKPRAGSYASGWRKTPSYVGR